MNESPMMEALSKQIDHEMQDWVENLRIHDLEVIRAFVERVEKRSKEYAPKGYLSQQYWHDAMVDELAAMEKESNGSE